MEIVSTPTHRGFIIRDDSGEETDVYYKSYFSSTATTEIDGTAIELKSQKAWTSTVDIIKNNVDCGDMEFNWKGHVNIQFFDNTMMERKWLIKPKGILSRVFEVFDEKGTLFFTITPRMNWKTMSYNYSIKQESPDISKVDLLELLVYCGYGIHLVMQRSNGAG